MIKDYTSLLQTHVFGHALAKKPIRDIDDGDVNLYLADLKAKRAEEGYA
jgi:hypothetical protein